MTNLRTSGKTPVAPVAFGTMQFGGKADAAASTAMFEACLDAGVTHFDTAVSYTDGASEQILGRLIRGHADVFVATKVGYTGGAGRDNLLRQFDLCQSRLGGRIDLLYLHRFDNQTDLRETIGTFADLQAKGAIRHIGVSNFAAWQVMKAQAIAADFGTRIDAMQPMYSLVKRQAEVEILPMCADQGIAAMTYSPLGGGALSGKYASGGTGRLTEDMRYKARYSGPGVSAAAAKLAKLGAELGVHPATLAVAWVRACPHGAQPILSARSLEQLTPSLDAMRFDMDAELYARISAFMPAPPPATDRNEET